MRRRSEAADLLRRAKELNAAVDDAKTRYDQACDAVASDPDAYRRSCAAAAAINTAISERRDWVWAGNLNKLLDALAWSLSDSARVAAVRALVEGEERAAEKWSGMHTRHPQPPPAVRCSALRAVLGERAP